MHSPVKKRASKHLRNATTNLKIMRNKEKGWQGGSNPISRHNERVHSSMRMIFEKL